MKEIKLIIAGGRNIKMNQFKLEMMIDALFSSVNISEIIQGGCPSGVDLAAHYYAIREFGESTKWDTQPKANQEMAEYADALLLIWDGEDEGAEFMLGCAKKEGLDIIQIIL